MLKSIIFILYLTYKYHTLNASEFGVPVWQVTCMSWGQTAARTTASTFHSRRAWMTSVSNCNKCSYICFKLTPTDRVENERLQLPPQQYFEVQTIPVFFLQNVLFDQNSSG